MDCEIVVGLGVISFTGIPFNLLTLSATVAAYFVAINYPYRNISSHHHHYYYYYHHHHPSTLPRGVL